MRRKAHERAREVKGFVVERQPCAGCSYGRNDRGDHEAECQIAYRATGGADPAPIPLLELPVPPDPKATIEQRLKAQIRDGHRGLELLRDGPGPWTCERCGPLTRREEPLHGQDERMHCPRCDGPCSTGVGDELEKTKPEGSPWEHPGKKAARIAARGGNAP